MPDLVPQSASPLQNPSYPQRIHVHERARWQALLESWDARIAQARAELDRDQPHDPVRQKLYFQMCGARDQLAEAAHRLPLEVGDLYAEDLHRLEEAVAALERLSARWSRPD